jgi:trehalose-6-phosphatase
MTSAENGAYLKTPNGQWEDLFTDVDVSWKPAVMEVRDMILMYWNVIHRS